MTLHSEALFIVQAIILVGLPFIIWRIPQIRKYIPLVVIQILVGVFLGPSILGMALPSVYQYVFPASSLTLITGLGWAALLFFGLLTGLHLDFDVIRGQGIAFITISLASIFIPLTLGIAGAWWAMNYSHVFIGENATPLTFMLSIGIATGVTALPVLGAILLELGIIDKPLGKMALGFATVNDGLLWILVSILLSLSSSQGGASNVIRTIILTIAYFSFMVLIIRPALNWVLTKRIKNSHISNNQLVGIVCLMLFSALATELTGIHYLLGAFVFGAVFPKKFAHTLYQKTEPLIIVFLLPFFFMSTGLKTMFNVTAIEVWILFVVIGSLSMIGKLFGTGLTAKYFGYSWKSSTLLGGFMQCKGLMEVVVLTMMLQAKIISPITFSGMILMAVATTAATVPLVLLISRGQIHSVEMQPASPI
jgi:Kef-type K+ transport system membrane component KefB